MPSILGRNQVELSDKPITVTTRVRTSDLEIDRFRSSLATHVSSKIRRGLHEVLRRRFAGFPPWGPSRPSFLVFPCFVAFMLSGPRNAISRSLCELLPHLRERKCGRVRLVMQPYVFPIQLQRLCSFSAICTFFRDSVRCGVDRSCAAGSVTRRRRNDLAVKS